MHIILSVQGFAKTGLGHVCETVRRFAARVASAKAETECGVSRVGRSIEMHRRQAQTRKGRKDLKPGIPAQPEAASLQLASG